MRRKAVPGACYRGEVKIAVIIPALDESSQISGVIESALLGSAEPVAQPSAGNRATARLPEDGAAAGFGNVAEVAVPSGRATPAAPLPSSASSLSSGGATTGSAACDLEVLVADGGSLDDTCDRARRAGARVVEAPRGRARQLQAGLDALGARSDTEPEAVVFLHADTRLPAGWAGAVRAALCRPDVVGGAFRFAFEREPGVSLGERFALAMVERIARMRVAVFGLPYGDQGLFARREVLDAMGGIPQVDLMEDLDLVRALRTRGRLASLSLCATTSARRHREHGVMRTACWHAWALVAWRLGVPRTRIAGWLGR